VASASKHLSEVLNPTQVTSGILTGPSAKEFLLPRVGLSRECRPRNSRESQADRKPRNALKRERLESNILFF
jgi:hypothetical protein